MATALYWLIQRRDPKQPKDPYAWVTIHNCASGTPYTYATQAKAIAGLKKFTATQPRSAMTSVEFRIARIYKVTAADAGL